MAPLLFAPEEVFNESAIIIDHLISVPQTIAVEKYIIGLWNELRIKISKWEKTATQQNLDMALSSIYYTVAIVMSRHWCTFYNIDVTKWLLQTVINNMKVDHREIEHVFYDLLDECDGIEEWINNNYDGHLSDEISNVIKGKAFFKQAITNPSKANAIIKLLHKMMDDKKKPKDIMMPIRAAIEVGAIRRPTDEEFYEEFGINKIKGKSSINDYTNPDKTPYCGPDFESMKAEFNKIIDS